jgi:hypothetical protein
MQDVAFYYLQSEIDYRRERLTSGSRTPRVRRPSRLRRHRRSAGT